LDTDYLSARDHVSLSCIHVYKSNQVKGIITLDADPPTEQVPSSPKV